jgi:23S rRNA pseudouridine955/2504/2580 synthase
MPEIVVPAHETPKTLESFLKRRYPIGYVRKLFRKSAARIDGRRAKAADLIKPGNRVQLYLRFETTTELRPARSKLVDLRVIFEDGSLLVVDKPAGTAVHEGKTVSKQASLLGVLERRYHQEGIKPLLVHRLDKDTSGLLLVAKHREALDRLTKIFETGEVEKEYLCLVAGRLPWNHGTIDFPLPGREGDLVRAVTRYRVLQRFAETTLVRVIIETGRLHQIRLHFARLGYPVVMDRQHGDFGFNKRFRKEYGLRRQFLHAHRLKLSYGGKAHEWRAPEPDDLRATLRRLKS